MIIPGKSVPFLKAFLCFIFLAGNFTISAFTQSPTKPRIILTADPELDDNNSLIRFLLYSTDYNIEGLIYASSGFHWKGDGKGTKWFVPGREYNRFGLDLCPCESWRWAKDERFIHDAVKAYEKSYSNLKIHNAAYPTPADLQSKIRYGNIEFDGDISKDSPGSDLIRSLILDNKPGQLYITAWGGQSTIARALKSIKDQYEFTDDWERIRKKISAKVVLLPSGDQDDTYANYIKPNWPEIEYRQFRNGPNYGYGAQLRTTPENAALLTPQWMKQNVSDRGAFGKLYRVWGDGKQMVKDDKLDYFGLAGYTDEQLKQMGYVVWMPVQPKGSWLGEGDTFTFMNMLNNGLRAYEKGMIGGWSGRQVNDNTTNIFAFSSSDTSAQSMASTIGSMNVNSNNNFPDFFPAAQNDFAARMKWSVTPSYKAANHEPVVKIEVPKNILVNPGQKIRLNGSVKDPDGNNVSVKWYQMEVGSYPGRITLQDSTSLQSVFIVPQDIQPKQTIHIILEVKDNGSPALTRYQRVVITAREK